MADIIELLERRDEKGLVLLKEKYADYCYSIIYGLLRSHEQTEEALSDVWLAIWNSIPPARPLRLRAYLAKTARNTALHYLRHDARKIFKAEAAQLASAFGIKKYFHFCRRRERC